MGLAAGRRCLAWRCPAWGLTREMPPVAVAIGLAGGVLIQAVEMEPAVARRAEALRFPLTEALAAVGAARRIVGREARHAT